MIIRGFKNVNLLFSTTTIILTFLRPIRDRIVPVYRWASVFFLNFYERCNEQQEQKYFCVRCHVRREEKYFCACCPWQRTKKTTLKMPDEKNDLTISESFLNNKPYITKMILKDALLSKLKQNKLVKRGFIMFPKFSSELPKKYWELS